MAAQDMNPGTEADAPTVSVVIPHFNAPELLARAIGSFASDVKILVVDNSTDPALSDAAKEVAWTHGAAWISMGRNAGFAAACNAGIAASETALVLLFNQDAQMSAGSLDLLLGHVAGASTCGAVSPAIVTPERRIWFAGGRFDDRTGRVVLERFGEPHTGGAPIASGFLSGCALMVRREAFDDVGGFDERFFLYYEDVELGERLRGAGWTLDVVRDAVVVHDRGQLGDPMRNLSPTMLEHSIRSRRVFGGTRRGAGRLVAGATLPVELARLWLHAVRADPSAWRSSTAALFRGLLG